MVSTTQENVGISAYKVWWSMIDRCTDPQCAQWKYYGERGITVCPQWQNSYRQFMDDMGPRMSIEYTVDRLNVNGNYEPGNCAWKTYKEQARNKRNNVWITYEGKTQIIKDWADEKGISSGTIGKRIKAGWPTDKLFIPSLTKEEQLIARREGFKKAYENGTLPPQTSCGEVHPYAVLTNDLVVEIRRRYDSGESPRIIAKDLGHDRKTVEDAAMRRTWKHIKEIDGLEYVRKTTRRRNTHLININGVEKTLTEWSKESGVKSATIRQRLILGWPVEDILKPPMSPQLAGSRTCAMRWGHEVPKIPDAVVKNEPEVYEKVWEDHFYHPDNVIGM